MPAPKLTPYERFLKTQAATKAKDAERQAAAKRLREEEAATLHKLYQDHLWALAKALDAAGLGAYDVPTLAPHFKALAAHLLTLAAPPSEEPHDGHAPASVPGLRHVDARRVERTTRSLRPVLPDDDGAETTPTAAEPGEVVEG